MKQLLGMVFLAGILAGCGTGPGDSQGVAGERPTYTEVEQILDFQNLNLEEKRLVSIGLKINETVEFQNSVSTRVYSWDEKYFTEFLKKHPEQNAKTMLPQVEQYLGVAEQFLKKYDGTFNIKKGDGSVKAYELVGSVREAVQSKITITKMLITRLKSLL